MIAPRLVHAPERSGRGWRRADVTARSVKLMLLGIALLLFGMVFPSTINPVLIYYFGLALDRGMLGAMIVSILPVMGLVLVLVGFFKREA
jgi:hypothetical protein